MQNGEDKIGLRVYSIFDSISGEVGLLKQGSRTTFIRLAGCNIRCSYCDTPEAQDIKSGQWMSIDAIIKKVEEIGNSQILITGGEPLLQVNGLRSLIAEFQNYLVQIETNGTILPPTDIDVDCYVVDCKLPGSGLYDQRCLEEMVPQLSDDDYLKFVCVDGKDYAIAVNLIKEIEKGGFGLQSAISMTNTALTKELIEWIREDNINAIVNVQLHKLIGLKEDKRN